MIDEEGIRERAQALCGALVAGNIDLVIETFSAELRQNLGEVISLLPLPVSAADVESVAHGGSGYNVVLLLTGDNETVQLQTRWKDRDGRATVIEVSHLSRVAREPAASEGTAALDGEGASSAG
ncbi:MAG: hypothetical protein ACRDGI_02640 [Candidatus Limnocylindrales bacterium]